MNKQSSKMNKQRSKRNKQSSKMNVKQYNGVNRAVKWINTFILLLCLPHFIVWHLFYCSVYPIVLSDIHFTALFINFTALFRQYNDVNRAVKWMSDNAKEKTEQ
jgi:hypothetical protein